jgi:ankyrin repeat protein
MLIGKKWPVPVLLWSMLSLAGCTSQQDLNRRLMEGAARGNVRDVLEALEAGAEVDAEDAAGHTAMARAIDRGDTAIVAALARHGATLATPLQEAIARRSAGEMRELLESGADPNDAGPVGLALNRNAPGLFLVLMEHGAELRSPLRQAVELNEPELVHLLLEHGAAVNEAASTGETLLHTAAARGYLDIVRMLLAYGAEVEARLATDVGGNPDVLTLDAGATPLHWAAYTGQAEVVLLLIAHGAGVNARTQEGLTPFHYAMYNRDNETINALRKHGAKPWMQDRAGRRPRDMAALPRGTALLRVMR